MSLDLNESMKESVHDDLARNESGNAKKRNEYIMIKVVNEFKCKVHYKIRPKTHMCHLMNNYKKKQIRNGRGKNWHFTYIGSCINGSETPEKLEIEDGDFIHVFKDRSVSDT